MNPSTLQALVPMVFFFYYLLVLAVIVFIVWQVISALRRISKGVEDIAETLRRIETKEPPSHT